MFDDDSEDLFKPYEYNDTDLEDLCDTLMENMNNQYAMGELEFSISSLTARNVENEQVRIDCSYDHGDGEQPNSISFTIPSYVAHKPLEARMYDTIVEMA